MIIANFMQFSKRFKEGQEKNMLSPYTDSEGELDEYETYGNNTICYNYYRCSLLCIGILYNIIYNLSFKNFNNFFFIFCACAWQW